MTKSIYDVYETDPAAERDGVWVEFRGGVLLKVRSADCEDARDLMQRQMKRSRSLIIANQGILPPNIQDQHDIELLSRVLIADWDEKTVPGRDGNPIPFDTDAVAVLMRDLPGLRREALMVARTEETFRRAELEALAKNSSST